MHKEITLKSTNVYQSLDLSCLHTVHVVVNFACQLAWVSCGLVKHQSRCCCGFFNMQLT